MKTVLFVNFHHSPVSMRMLDGVFRYAHEAKWNVQVVDTVSEGALAKLVEFWNPVGCVYGANDVVKPELLRIIRDRPLVLLDCDPALDVPGCGKVCHDPEDPARTVAREFLEMGLGHVAFCGYSGFYHWTESREAAFRRILALHGRDCTSLWIDPADAEGDALRRALRALPRPCGLFVSNDDIGRRVLGACRLARIAVPKDMAVISVDNDDLICDHTKPPLSSILMDNERAGYEGAALLADMLAGAPPRTVRYGVRLFARRGSSHVVRVSDARVRRAVEFIEENAQNRIAVPDVARVMGCSPRMAEMLFRRARVRAVRDEIADARIALVKRLLADRRIGLSAIAGMCGYADDSSLRRLFLAKVGCPMSEWRRGNAR